MVLTSNATRELSEALRRRCLFLHIEFPSAELERQIVESQVPDMPQALTDSLIRIINALRAMPLRKLPSVSETLDWARTLMALGAKDLDPELVSQSLGVILKHQDDIDKAREKLDVAQVLE